MNKIGVARHTFKMLHVADYVFVIQCGETYHLEMLFLIFYFDVLIFEK